MDVNARHDVVDITGRDRVDADVVLGPFRGEGPDELIDAALACRIGRQCGNADEPGDGRRDGDGATLCRGSRGRRVL